MILESFGNVQFVLFSTIWLDLVEVCMLDTAICSTLFRDQYLDAFATQSSIFRSATENDSLHSSCIEWLNRRHLSVKELSLDSWNPKFRENRTVSALKFVEVLTCTKELNVTDSQLVELLHILSATLRKLVISYSDHVTSKSFKIALSKCQQLTEISLVDCSRFDSTCVDIIVKNCPQLTSFSLKDSDDLVNYVSLVKLITQCERLKTIRIEKKTVQDIVIQAIVEYCQCIETIELRSQSYLADTYFADLTFPNTLKYVDLSFSGIGEPTIHKLLKECPLLDTLILYYLDVSAELFTGSYDYVTKLNMTHLNISDSTVDEAGCLTIGKCFPNLTYLNMENSIDSDVGDGVLHLSNLSKLTFLSLNCNYSLQPKSKHMIELLYRNLNLSTLLLDGFCDAEIVKAIALLPHCSKNVTALVISNCDDIDDGVIETLAANCHELTHLDLSHTYITDVSMTHIASGCRELTTLILEEMSHTTNKGYIECLKECKKLKVFEYSNEYSNGN